MSAFFVSALNVVYLSLLEIIMKSELILRKVIRQIILEKGLKFKIKPLPLPKPNFAKNKVKSRLERSVHHMISSDMVAKQMKSSDEEVEIRNKIKELS